jgi:transposase
MKLSIGIDVSKKKLDVSFFKGDKHLCISISNDESGILELDERIARDEYADILITMEATGTYHLSAAKKLHELGHKVSVINPLIIRRFSEMMMMRAKTDAVDARIIAEYGYFQKPAIFKPKDKKMELVVHLSKAIEDINLLKNQTSNRIEALQQNPDVAHEVLEMYTSLLREYAIKIQHIEQRIKEIMKDNIHFKRMKTIPGIGDRIASVFTGTFGNFEDFENAKQVASFIGVNPSPCTSGTTVKGKGAISKKGNGYLRKLLYMGTLSAIRFNKQCKELYERLVLRGKDKRLALIAVCNKLIRQIFAIVKFNRIYCENF